MHSPVLLLLVWVCCIGSPSYVAVISLFGWSVCCCSRAGKKEKIENTGDRGQNSPVPYLKSANLLFGVDQLLDSRGNTAALLVR